MRALTAAALTAGLAGLCATAFYTGRNISEILVAQAATTAAPFSPRDAAVFVETAKGTGSGVVIAPGLVLTAKHVVEKVESLKADGREARVLWTSGPGGDIALLAADTTGRRPAEINCAAPAQGDDIVVHGNPLILRDIATHGKIASASAQKVDELEDVVVLDATINPGNSGGGVFGKDGRLVGIIDAVMLAPSSHPMMTAITPLGLMTPGPVLCKLLGRGV